MTGAETPIPRKVWWASVCLLFVLGVAPYWQGRSFAFVYDDHGQIVDNAFLTSEQRWADLFSLRTLSDPTLINGRRPLTLLSHLLDRTWWGLNPIGWHLTNYLLHALNGILLFTLLIRLSRYAPASRPHPSAVFLAALCVVWHPAMVEAVQVPAFRPDLIVVFFLLMTLHTVFPAATGRSLGTAFRLALASFSALAAVLAKESGVIALASVWLMWWIFPRTRGSLRQMMGWSGVTLLLIAGFWGLCMRVGADAAVPSSWQALGAEWNGRSLLPPTNFLTMPWLWAHYLWLLVCPVGLLVDHVVPPVTQLMDFRLWIGLAVGLLTVAFWWRTDREQVWRRFGLGLTLLGFAPVSNLVPLLNPVAERYMPPMVLGFAIWLMLGWQGQGHVRRWMWGRIIYLTLLLVWTILRVPVFASDHTLWHQTVKDQPRSARAHTWVGLLARQAGDVDRALHHYQQAQQLNPYDLTPLINQALIHGQRGELAEAARLMEQALAIRPSFPPVHATLAMIRYQQGDGVAALAHLDEALRLDPYHLPARRLRIQLHRQTGHWSAVRTDAEWLRERYPDDPLLRGLPP